MLATSHSSPLSSADESRMIADAKAGDQKAFRELVNTYQDTIYRFAFNVCRNEEMASETLQNTFINVYQKLYTFDGRSKFSTWLYSIVANNCLIKRRETKSRRREISFDDPKVEHETNAVSIQIDERQPITNLLNDELKAIFDATIKKLPVNYRIVFVMRDLEDMPASEVAKVLGISVPAVKSRLFRAREFLRTHLEPYYKGTKQ